MIQKRFLVSFQRLDKKLVALIALPIDVEPIPAFIRGRWQREWVTPKAWPRTVETTEWSDLSGVAWRRISINGRHVTARIGTLTCSAALASHGKSMDSRSSDLTYHSIGTPFTHLLSHSAAGYHLCHGHCTILLPKRMSLRVSRWIKSKAL